MTTADWRAESFAAQALGWYTVPGWRSLMVVESLIGSAMLISIGVVGEYLAKLYEQSKQRPLYIVARTFNVDTASNIDAASKGATASKGANSR